MFGFLEFWMFGFWSFGFWDFLDVLAFGFLDFLIFVLFVLFVLLFCILFPCCALLLVHICSFECFLEGSEH